MHVTSLGTAYAARGRPRDGARLACDTEGFDETVRGRFGALLVENRVIITESKRRTTLTLTLSIMSSMGGMGSMGGMSKMPMSQMPMSGGSMGNMHHDMGDHDMGGMGGMGGMDF